jgi:hypothetical protein
MPIYANGSLDGLGILHPKFLEYVLSVFRLDDECALLELLDLKSKEIFQLPHHGHLIFCTIIILNSTQDDLLVDPKIIPST